MICYFMLSFGCQFCYSIFFFFFKQKTAYEMRISDWSSDVCSSDLPRPARPSRSASLIGVAAPAMRERARHGGDHVERGADDADADRLVGPPLRARAQHHAEHRPPNTRDARRRHRDIQVEDNSRTDRWGNPSPIQSGT